MSNDNQNAGAEIIMGKLMLEMNNYKQAVRDKKDTATLNEILDRRKQLLQQLQDLLTNKSATYPEEKRTA